MLYVESALKGKIGMSEEGGFGLTLAERFFGLIVLIVGGISAYYTLTSIQSLDPYSGLFVFLTIVLIAVGIIMLTAKTE
jgi:hypothetical protein